MSVSFSAFYGPWDQAGGRDGGANKGLRPRYHNIERCNENIVFYIQQLFPKQLFSNNYRLSLGFMKSELKTEIEQPAETEKRP